MRPSSTRTIVWAASVLAAAMLGALVARQQRGDTGSGEPVSVQEAPRVVPVQQDPPAPDGPDDAAEEQAPDSPDTREEAAEDPAVARGSMRVVVRDAFDLRPLEGARVTLTDGLARPTARTDEQGIAVLPLLAPDALTELTVRLDGYCPWSATGRPVASLAVTLEPAATLFGLVLAEDGLTPVPGAELALLAPDGGPATASATSGRDGSYELGPVPTRAAGTLEVSAEGFARLRRTFTLRSGEARVRQDVVLSRGTPIRGRVEDWAGRGIAGARVGGVTADEFGDYSGTVATRPGTWIAGLDIRAEGHATLHAVVDLAVTGEHDFRLPGLASLEGTVSSPDGPLEDALVRAEVRGPLTDGPIEETSPLHDLPEGWSYELPRSGGLQAVATDAEGRYRLRMLPWCLNVVAHARAPGRRHEEVRFQAMDGPGSVRRVDFWFDGGGTADAFLFGRALLNGTFADLTGSLAWEGPSSRGSGVIARGGFRVAVEPGEVRLRATLDLAPDAPLETTVDVLAGDDRRLDLDFRVPVAPLRGAVLYTDGRPVAGETVLAVLEGTPMHLRAETDEKGVFSLVVPDVAATFTVSLASLETRPPSRERVVPGARGVDFVAEPTVPLLLRVLHAETGTMLTPGSEVQVLAETEHGWFRELGPLSSLPDAAGWYELRLVPGDVGLLVLPVAASLSRALPARAGIDPLGPPERAEVVIANGVDVELELAREGWPPGQQLFLVEEELAWLVTQDGYDAASRWYSERRTVVFGADGRALVPGLGPGMHRLVTIPPLDDPRTGTTPQWIHVEPALLHVDAGMPPVRVEWTRAE